MTREAKIARARELRAEGVGYDAIGEALGVTASCVWKWLHPERTKAWAGRDNSRSDPRVAARKRRADQKRDRDLSLRGTCGMCHGPMGIGNEQDGVCGACRTAIRDANWTRIEDMWAAGWTLPEIAASLGWSRGHIASEMDRMRKAGRDLPYRYAMQDGRRVAA